MAALRPRIFRLADVKKSTKQAYLHAVVRSRCLHNAGSWPDLRVAESSRLQNAVTRVYRQAFHPFCADKPKQPSYRQVLLDHNLQPLPLILARARLGLFCRVVTQAPPALDALLSCAQASPRSWLRSVTADLQLLTQSSLDCPFSSGGPDSILMEAAASIQSNPSRFRAFVRRACSDTKLFQLCIGSGPPTEVQSVAPRTISDELVCYECGRTFPTLPALASHTRRVHMVANPVHLRVCTQWCPTCLLFFGTIPRVREHVSRSSHRCRDLVLQHFAPLDASDLLHVEEACAQDAASAWKQWRIRTKALTPVTQAQGPLPAFAAGRRRAAPRLPASAV